MKTLDADIDIAGVIASKLLRIGALQRYSSRESVVGVITHALEARTRSGFICPDRVGVEVASRLCLAGYARDFGSIRAAVRRALEGV